MLNWVFLKIEPFWYLTDSKKNYTNTKLNCLKFNSVLNEPKRVDYAVKQTNQPTNILLTIQRLRNQAKFILKRDYIP